MDWGLNFVASDDGTFAYYWRDGNALFEKVSSDEDFQNQLESGLQIIAEKCGLKNIFHLFEGDGTVRLSTSFFLNIVRNGTGQKTGLILNEGALDDLSEEEKRILPLTGDNVVYVSDATVENLRDDKSGSAEEVITAYKNLLKVGVHSVVIGLGGSGSSREREYDIQRILTETYPSRYLGGVPIYVSSDFEPEQTGGGVKSLTVFSALAQARMRKYLFDFEQRLKEMGYRGGLFLGNRDGGLTQWDKTRTIDTADAVFSSIMTGAAVMAAQSELNNVLVFHTGAYSTSVGVIHKGRVQETKNGTVLGVSINAPSCEWVNVPVGMKTGISIPDGKVVFREATDDDISLGDVEDVLGYTARGPDSSLKDRFKSAVADGLKKEGDESALAVRRAYVTTLSNRVKEVMTAGRFDPSTFVLFPTGIHSAAYGWEMGTDLGLKAVHLPACHEYMHAFGLAAMGSGALKGPIQPVSSKLEAGTIDGPAVARGMYGYTLVPSGVKLVVAKDLNGILEAQ